MPKDTVENNTFFFYDLSTLTQKLFYSLFQIGTAQDVYSALVTKQILVNILPDLWLSQRQF